MQKTDCMQIMDWCSTMWHKVIFGLKRLKEKIV